MRSFAASAAAVLAPMTIAAERSLIERLEQEAAVRMGGGDGSHDLAHARRVRHLAVRLALETAEPFEELVIAAAAYLHDAVTFEKNDPRRSRASFYAAEHARSFLVDIGFPAELVEDVAHAIEAHSFSAGVAPLTIEACVVQDADRLEALGALGLARTFYVAGRLGSKLFDAQDPLAKRRQLDDRVFALDHFQSKLFALPDTMQTAPGKRMAEQRVAVLRRFVDDLIGELTAPGGLATGN